MPRRSRRDRAWRSRDTLLAKPLTFMNASGEAVGALLRYFKIEPRICWSIVDEVQLPLAKLRARARGSAGGHNGLKSIIAHLGDEFRRLRSAWARRRAARPRRSRAGEVRQDEAAEVERMTARAAEAAETFITSGIEAVMNGYNGGDPRQPNSREAVPSGANLATDWWPRCRVPPSGGRVGPEEHHADRQYELVYILPPRPPNSRRPSCTSRCAHRVAAARAIEKTENWGRRKLAYEIGHFKEGVYVLEVINGSGELMKELDRRLKVVDQVDPPHDRPRRRGKEGRRAHAHQAPDRVRAPPRQARPAAAAPAWRRPLDGHDDWTTTVSTGWRFSMPFGQGRRAAAAAAATRRTRKQQGQRRPMFRAARSASSARTRSTTSTTRTSSCSAVRAGARQDSAAPHLGTCAMHQRKLQTAIKRARQLALDSLLCTDSERDHGSHSREHVDNLGRRGEVVKVADGYARNYLLPRKLALLVTDGNKKQIERERAKFDAQGSRGSRKSRGDRRRLAAVDDHRAQGRRDRRVYGSVTTRHRRGAAAKGLDIDRSATAAGRADQEARRVEVPVKLHRT
jgi:PTH1 family peptidyl-tRNA hydrolase